MQLTENFSKSEFDCKSGANMPDDVFFYVERLAIQLQVLRDYLKRPIRITSGYRNPHHNAGIKGASKNSQHIYGKAVDIQVKNMEAKQVYSVIEQLINDGKMQEGGLGLYDTWVHYDIRGFKARWDKTKKW